SLLERDSTEMSPGTIADLFHFLAEDDPQDAAQRALEFTLQNSPADTQFGVELVLEKWYKKSPEAASKWVMGQEDPESTRMMLPLLAAAISRTKGVAALEGVWNRLDDPQRIDFVKGIDHFNEDIDMVFKWANDHIESPVQHRELLTTLLN